VYHSQVGETAGSLSESKLLVRYYSDAKHASHNPIPDHEFWLEW